MILSILLWGIVTLVASVFVYMQLKHRSQVKYFNELQVPYLGSGSGGKSGFMRLFRLLTGSIDMPTMETEVYEEATAHKGARFVGAPDFFSIPTTYITDLDLVRNVYVKDFEHFHDRRPVQTEHSNHYFRRMVVMLEGDLWKGTRAKLSPSFTTGKIRRMFSIFRSSSENMSNFIGREIGSSSNGSDFDFATAFPKYAMDVIASCAFGVDSKCFDVPSGQTSTFEDYGKRFQFNFKPSMFFKFMVMMIAPKVADAFKLEVFDTVPQNYFASIIKDVMKKRRESGQRYDDFLQLMMDTQQGLVKIDDDTQEVMNGTTEKMTGLSDRMDDKKISFDDDDIVANCLLFLLGGFDTTQSLLLFTVYQLALEPEVQEKLYQEVKEKMDAHDGKLTYEGVLEMTYLDLVLNETLRYYPPAARTERVCTKTYEVPDSKFVIQKGGVVAIPIYPIHHDPKYFPNPSMFDPDRFLPENKAARHPYAFMPFGHGPRNCIGMRFALTEVKAVIAQLVYSFQLEPCQKTMIPIQFDTNSNLKPKGGMWLRATPRPSP